MERALLGRLAGGLGGRGSGRGCRRGGIHADVERAVLFFVGAHGGAEHNSEALCRVGVHHDTVGDGDIDLFLVHLPCAIHAENHHHLFASGHYVGRVHVGGAHVLVVPFDLRLLVFCHFAIPLFLRLMFLWIFSKMEGLLLDFRGISRGFMNLVKIYTSFAAALAVATLVSGCSVSDSEDDEYSKWTFSGWSHSEYQQP